MEIVKLYFLRISLLIISVLIGCIRANYNFKPEDIRDIEKSFRITYHGKYSEHAFAGMDFEARKKLCLEAQEAHTLLSGMNEEHIVFEAEVWLIRYFDSEKELREVAIKCPTTPPSYLRPEDRNRPFQVNIMLIQNISERYKFEKEFLQYVELVETTLAHMSEQEDEETDVTGLEEVPEDDISFWTAEDRLNLCVAARNYVDLVTNGNMIMPGKVFPNKPEIYEFRYSKKKVMKCVAVKCPTTPEMYIRLANQPDVVMVALLKDDFPDVSGGESSRQRKGSTSTNV